MIALEKQTALALAQSTVEAARPLQPRYIKIPTAVTYSGIGRSTLYELLNAGKIRSHKIGSARVIDRESLDAFIAAQPSAAGMNKEGRNPQ